MSLEDARREYRYGRLTRQSLKESPFDQFCLWMSQAIEAKISDPDILALTEKVEYRIDPKDEYPRNYSGHVRATVKGGSVRETIQPHLRGGVREPLDRNELVDKFRANLTFGGISQKHSGEIEDTLSGLFDAPDMSPLAACRLE
jgi:2-methylcitrate dehydratase PrpD